MPCLPARWPVEKLERLVTVVAGNPHGIEPSVFNCANKVGACPARYCKFDEPRPSTITTQALLTLGKPRRFSTPVMAPRAEMKTSDSLPRDFGTEGSIIGIVCHRQLGHGFWTEKANEQGTHGRRTHH